MGEGSTPTTERRTYAFPAGLTEQSATGWWMEEPPGQTVVAVDKSDRYFVNGLPVRKEELRQKVEEILEDKKERIILIKADEDARYAAVMDAMDELRASGIEDMGLITDPMNRTGLLGGGGGK